jgi:hypothetical protein
MYIEIIAGCTACHKKDAKCSKILFFRSYLAAMAFHYHYTRVGFSYRSVKVFKKA